MMKGLRVLMLGLVLTLLLSAAVAETGRIGTPYTLDGTCSFTVESIEDYDVFFNQESGAGKQWVVVNFSLLNWRYEPFFMKADTAAQLIYDGDFDYEADHLWADPIGAYYADNVDRGASLHVYAIRNNTVYFKLDQNTHPFSNDNGVRSNRVDYQKMNVNANPQIRIGYGYSGGCAYNPTNDTLVHSNGAVFKSQDASKTVLEPFVERDYHYVFLVPDLVAEDEGMREMILTVAGEEFVYRF